MNPAGRDLNSCFATYFFVNKFKWDAYLLTLELLSEYDSIKKIIIRVVSLEQTLEKN